MYLEKLNIDDLYVLKFKTNYISQYILNIDNNWKKYLENDFPQIKKQNINDCWSKRYHQYRTTKIICDKHGNCKLDYQMCPNCKSTRMMLYNKIWYCGSCRYHFVLCKECNKEDNPKNWNAVMCKLVTFPNIIKFGIVVPVDIILCSVKNVIKKIILKIGTQ